MKPLGKAASGSSRDDVQAALAAMGADELRQVVRELMLKLDERVHGRVASTDQQHRRHYGHAASPIPACIACDGSPEAERWVATLRARYRRFPALCAELDRRVGFA